MALCLVIVACATGEDNDRFAFFGKGAPSVDAGRDARRAASPEGDDDDHAIPPQGDAGSADASDGSAVLSGTVSCGGYAYPEVVTIPSLSCTGIVSGCTGAHVFRTVGCYTSELTDNPCPDGFKVASLMLVGQWAQAANVTRLSTGSRACMWTFGGAQMTSACGADVANYAYCWTKGGQCAGGCSGHCCEGYQGSSPPPCADQSGTAYPLLCVQ